MEPTSSRYADESTTVGRARAKAAAEIAAHNAAKTPENLDRVGNAAKETRSHWDALRERDVQANKAQDSDRIAEMRDHLAAAKQDPRITAIVQGITAPAA